MLPVTITKAMSYAISERLDHLTLSPEVLIGACFCLLLQACSRFSFTSLRGPQKPKTRKAVASSASARSTRTRFGLPRSRNSRAIRMRPDDDIKLGKIIKQSGHRQEMLQGTQMIQVEWYASIGELIRGTEKNFFSGLEYSILAAIGASIVQIAFFVWPFAAIFLTSGAYAPIESRRRADNRESCFMRLTLLRLARGANMGVLFPVAVLMFVFLLWNLTLRTWTMAASTGAIRITRSRSCAPIKFK